MNANWGSDFSLDLSQSSLSLVSVLLCCTRAEDIARESSLMRLSLSKSDIRRFFFSFSSRLFSNWKSMQFRFIKLFYFFLFNLSDLSTILSACMRASDKWHVKYSGIYQLRVRAQQRLLKNPRDGLYKWLLEMDCVCCVYICDSCVASNS